MKADQADLERILTLVPVVASSPGITVGELARRFGVGEEQIRADLARVLLSGVPPYLPSDYVLVDYEGDRVYLAFAERFARPVGLLLEEALALSLALENLATLSGEEGARLARGLAGRLRELLGRRDEAAPGALERVDGAAPSAERELLDDLAAAIAARRPVEIEYYTAARDRMSRRIVWPHRFVEIDGFLYLRAHCVERGAERSFRIDRIRELDASAAVASRVETAPPEPAASAAGAGVATARARRELPTVCIRFDAEVARFVTERFSEVVRDPETGTAHLELQTEHHEWLYSWLLPYGGHAEILSPPEVRAGYVRRLDALLARYGEPGA